MKVIVAGSRDFDDYDKVNEELTEFHNRFTITEIVSGMCRGVDKLGERWAKENGIPIKVFPALWSKHGKAAGPIRNRQMALYADELILFWNGFSKGSLSMFESMMSLKKPINEVLI